MVKKVDVNPEKIEALLSRGVSEIIGLDDLRTKLISGKKLRVKLGIDPTSPNLHLGRSVPLLKLRDFQELGHQAVIIVGDFTGVIGDASDKDSERPMLDEKTIKKNKAGYFDQIKKIINLEKAELHYNSKWHKKLKYKEIGEQANLFSVADFIARDNIRRRLDAGKRVSLRETLYPLMQGYDSVAVKADVELGGTDQRFNMLAGRQMQPYYGQQPQNIVMSPLVEGLDGRKMSSSWGNTIKFTDNPSDMFGGIMSMHDDLVMNYLNMLTRLPVAQIEELGREFYVDPKTVKMRLAIEIVTMYHSADAAVAAQTAWQIAFSDRGVPEDILETEAALEEDLVDVVVRVGVVSSRAEFKRLVEEGAIKEKTNQVEIRISDPRKKVQQDLVVKIGKRRFLRIKVKQN